ncbi:MAG: N-acetylglucosamine-6-phosphate deacetylase [Chitinophagaceae bacterium]
MYSAKKIFTGTKWLYNQTLIIEQNKIVKIEPCKKPKYNVIVPAFVDNQIYGAKKQLFSVYKNTKSLQALQQHCIASGTAYFMPTVATNTYEVIYSCIDAVKKYWLQQGKGCLGLHIEGPWINPEKRGAHVQSLIHQPTLLQVKKLLDYGKGVIKVITLAPECCSTAIIKLIHQHNIVISIGHSNANYTEANKAFSLGINTCTHLFNAMPSLHHRSPNLLTAIFNNKKVTSSIIPDGHHVSFETIQLAKSIMGNRLYAITDAVTTTTKDYYTHEFKKDKYISNGILSGSSLTMYKAFKNLVEKCNIDETEALKMCSYYPAKVLNMHHKIGCIKPNATASFIVMDDNFLLQKVVTF